jgi:hypothetical protein
MDYKLGTGTVQCFVTGNKPEQPLFIHHYGLPQYDKKKPIMTPYLKYEGQKVVDKLNDGTITEFEAVVMLERI